MSSVANWAYTSWATLWKAKRDTYGKPTFSEPVHFLCGYGSELKAGKIDIGSEITIKLVFWTEYADARKGDFIAIGKHSGDPVSAGADEIKFIKRDEDLFEHVADDYTLITAV
ncbi:hypothetical protein [Morganella psychrotolerans]|uniref:Uncharacterized protein n=1 Tax=Morganella psychrotolerans TaxID=368603 RepID=A0A1B8HL19_9GAMM|nr:hypothetical protein [Morganella psychrotolerans]OBU09900.1 hypothetical protein AYY18_19005 [Morganella psychrotolerans]